MKIGIDKIGFEIPSYYITLEDLANARNIEPNKYTIGLGQNKMAIAEITQDPVSLAANTASKILDDNDKKIIDLIIFATESSIDESKAAGIFVKSLLGLSNSTRVVEVKQACYSSTIALQFAKNYILTNPDKKVLILTSDIAKYGLKNPGEPTQGAGSIAMLISKNPQILELEETTTYITEDIMDFWRPTNSEVPFVDGKLSTEVYIRFFKTTFNEYLEKTKLNIDNFEAICFHIPYTKLGYKALKSITRNEKLMKRYESSKYYNKDIGNIYTGSLYLSFLSLIESDDTLNSNDRIGFFAYGSGATGEFFSGKLVEGFKNKLRREEHSKQIENRILLTIDEYEKLYSEKIDPKKEIKKRYYFLGIENNIRIYNENKEF